MSKRQLLLQKLKRIPNVELRHNFYLFRENDAGVMDIIKDIRESKQSYHDYFHTALTKPTRTHSKSAKSVAAAHSAAFVSTIEDFLAACVYPSVDELICQKAPAPVEFSTTTHERDMTFGLFFQSAKKDADILAGFYIVPLDAVMMAAMNATNGLKSDAIFAAEWGIDRRPIFLFTKSELTEKVTATDATTATLNAKDDSSSSSDFECVNLHGRKKGIPQQLKAKFAQKCHKLQRANTGENFDADSPVKMSMVKLENIGAVHNMEIGKAVISNDWVLLELIEPTNAK